SRDTMKAEAASARPMKNQRCQPPALASSDQAMPVFSYRATSKKEVTVRLSPRRMSATISALANWSSNTTASAMPSHSHIEGLVLAERERERVAIRDERGSKGAAPCAGD